MAGVVEMPMQMTTVLGATRLRFCGSHCDVDLVDEQLYHFLAIGQVARGGETWLGTGRFK